MQELINFIISNLRNLWPVARIHSWQSGIRLRGGIIRDSLTPGLHFRIPFMDEVFKYPSNEVPIDLPPAAITTSDGKSIVLSANMSYQMTSIIKMYSGLWHAEESIRTVALGMVASLCANKSWEELTADRMGLEREIVDMLNAKLAEFGVHVVRVNLTDLVTARSTRHYLDGAQLLRG